MKRFISASFASVFSFLVALGASACGADTQPDDESDGQTSELTDAEHEAAAKAEEHPGGTTVETGTAAVTGTDLTTGSSCVTCGPLPDPWTKKAGPLPDPWKSTSSTGGGGGT